MKGVASRTIDIRGFLVMFATTKSNSPNGGVSRPIMILTTTTTPKWTRSMPSALCCRDQNWNDNEEDRRSFKQTSQDKQYRVDKKQIPDRSQLESCDKALDRKRNVFDCDYVVEDQCPGDQHSHRSSRLRARKQDGVQLFERDRAVYERRCQQRVRRRRALGRRHHPAVDAKQQYDRQHQCRKSIQCVMRGISRIGTGGSTG